MPVSESGKLQGLPDPALPSARQTRTGIGCILLGVMALTLQDALVKWLSPAIALHEITLVRSVIAIALTLVIVRLEGGLGLLRTRRPVLHIVRGILFVTANLCFFLAVASLPIAEATAVFFVAPLFIAVLSAAALGDRLRPRHWAAVLIGLTGMVIMLRPGGEALEWAALLPVAAAAAYAILQVVTRRLGVTDRASSMAFYPHVALAVASAVAGLATGDGQYARSAHPSTQFLLRAWVWPQGVEILLLLGCGVLIAGGTYFLSQAYRLARPSVVAPFEYAALPLSVLWGLLIWGDRPGITAALGMTLIAGSGLYVFFRETGAAGPRRTWQRNRHG